MRTILLSIVFLFPIVFQPTTHNDLNNEVTVNGLTYLYGEINREGLLSANYQSWFKARYDAYTPNKERLQECNEAALEGVSVKLLMATWCGDSKRNVPVFYKIMDELGFDENKLQVWALDRSKRGPNNEQTRFGVSRVPTMIFYRDDVEMGRFVERPQPGQKLEDIIVDIINRP